MKVSRIVDSSVWCSRSRWVGCGTPETDPERCRWFTEKRVPALAEVVWRCGEMQLFSFADLNSEAPCPQLFSYSSNY